MHHPTKYEWWRLNGLEAMAKCRSLLTDRQTDRRDGRCPLLRLLRRARTGVTGANYKAVSCTVAELWLFENSGPKFDLDLFIKVILK